MTDLLQNFISKIKSYDDIIIYGYRDRGKCVLDFIIYNCCDVKSSNYSGTVRYFATSAELLNEHEVKGIKVESISKLTSYAKDALVIVAMQEKHHENIKNHLEEYQFQNAIYVTTELYVELKQVEYQRVGITNQQVMQYHLNHSAKLEHLRNKVKAGKKVRVLFMTQRSAAFGCSSIYRCMEESDLFEPFIYPISKRDFWYNKFHEDVENDIEFFKERGYRVLNAYDEYWQPIDMENYHPDIIFFDSPNLYGPSNNSHFRLDLISWKYLTCYIPYGLLVVDSFYYHYENLNLRQSWVNFADMHYSYSRCLGHAAFNGNNWVMAGYPKFDEYMKTTITLPDKFKNGNKIVIYAPHWTLNTENNFATFDLYYKYFLNLLYEYPDINFIFKPHPELIHRIRKLSLTREEAPIRYEDYLAYIEEWNSLPNGLFVNDGEYIDIFRASSCLITDCGSFIGEYLPTKKPCIYLLNPRKKNPLDAYTMVTKEILDTYYLCETLDEIKENFNNLLIEEMDEKKDKRDETLKKVFPNIGGAGQFITNYLQNVICD